MSRKDETHILLLSYVFPPYPGIGGRRWVKFVKNISRMGYTVHVVHAKNPFSEESFWTSDVENDRVKTYALDGAYPKVLLTVPVTVFQKINYRLSLMIVKWFSKGTPYDRGVFWSRSAIHVAEKIIRKFQIRNVIVTCAPFSSGYMATRLKDRFVDLNLMIDFRDPWTWGPGYGFANLDKGRLEFENRMQKETVEKADKIFVPVEIMKKHLTELYPHLTNKIALLPHAFDQDEIGSKVNVKDETIDVIFYGTLYEEIGPYFEEITKALVLPDCTFRLHIYSDTKRYIELFDKADLVDKKVFYYDKLPTIELFRKIAVVDYILLIHPDRGVDNISTKFYEIIFSRTPIIYISKPGLASEFVTKNKLGYFFGINEIVKGVRDIQNNELPYPYNSTYNVEEYSFVSMTKTLINQHFVL